MAQIGKYEIRGELGRGGMAVVYRAFDVQLEREVALKVIGTEFANRPDFVHRFEREAKTIARLDHPNIIPLYDYGRDGNTIYFVTRLLSGGSLQDRIGQPIKPADAANIIAQIADALDYAHAQGVVHRDVKPSNILFDAHGRAILTDFGIVKLVDSATAKTMDVLGTPIYMSPEQVRSDELDGRSDQYSLAVVLYEMLTGQRLFDGQLLQVVYAHLNTPPPDPRALNPLLTQSMANTLQTALAKSPTQRYPSLTAFAQALGTSVAPSEATVLVPKPDPVKAAAPTYQVERTPPPTPAPTYIPPPPAPHARARRVPILAFVIGLALIAALGVFLLVPPLLRGNGTVTPATPTNPISAINITITPDTTLGAPTTVAAITTPPDTTASATAATVASIATVTPVQTASNGTTPIFTTPILTTPIRTTPLTAANTVTATLFQTLAKHTDDVHSVAWSPNGQFIASASSDKNVRLWRADGTAIATLNGHTATVNSVAWSPDAKMLASAAADKTVRLWRSDGTAIATLNGHTDNVESVVWSPNGQFVVSASRDKTARIWQANGTAVATLSGHTDSVSSVAWSPDGMTIATASFDKTVRLWRSTDGVLITTLRNNTNEVWSLAWSPDGKTLASGTSAGILCFWRADGTLITTITGHAMGIPRLDWSPDSKTLASASLDKTVRLWSANGTAIAVLNAHTDQVNRVAWSPNGQLIASASSDKSVRLWRADGTAIATLNGHTDAVTSLSWSPDSAALASGSVDNNVILWQIVIR